MPRNKFTDIEQAIQMRKNGATISEIETRLKVCKKTLYQYPEFPRQQRDSNGTLPTSKGRQDWLGKRITFLRTQANFSQKELTMLCGKDRDSEFIAMLEFRGGGRLETIVTVCQGLGITISEFFDGYETGEYDRPVCRD